MPMMLLMLAARSTLKTPDIRESRLSSGRSGWVEATKPRAHIARALSPQVIAAQRRGVSDRSIRGPLSTFQVQGRRFSPMMPAMAATLTPFWRSSYPRVTETKPTFMPTGR